MRAVLWGFLGVRRGDGHQEDMASLSFVHVIIAAVIGVIGFMTILLPRLEVESADQVLAHTIAVAEEFERWVTR